ncbi:MAG: ABC transporter permease [Planctomycetota bacterium]|nr:ABC transporter permease [Planctomycetota bacterium]
MRQFGTILADSFRESVDCKSLQVLLVLALILIVLCAGTSFETEKPEGVIEKQAALLGVQQQRGHRFGWAWLGGNVECKATDIKPVTAQEGWGPEFSGGFCLTLTFKTRDMLDLLTRRWRAEKALAEARARRPGVRPPEPPSDKDPLTPQDYRACLEGRFREMGYARTQAAFLSEDPPAFRLAVRTDYPHELCGASRMKLLYGAINFPLLQTSVAEMVVTMQLFMANIFAGGVGIFVAILVCSGFVPSMLQKGTLDLVLARPIGRGRLLLYKYIGGLWFVFILSAVLIAGCWLAITLRTGYANPWFLVTVVTITATFAVIHSVAVLVGVLSRSGTLAAMLAIFVWGTSATLLAIRNWLRDMYAGQMAPAWLMNTLDALYAIAPKTSDLAALNVSFLSRSHLSEQAFQRAFAGRLPKIDWAWSLSTTALFTLAMLALAMWCFRRKDY